MFLLTSVYFQFCLFISYYFYYHKSGLILHVKFKLLAKVLVSRATCLTVSDHHLHSPNMMFASSHMGAKDFV